MTPDEISGWFVVQLMVVQILFVVCIVGFFVAPFLTLITALMLFPTFIALCVNIAEEYYPDTAM